MKTLLSAHSGQLHVSFCAGFHTQALKSKKIKDSVRVSRTNMLNLTSRRFNCLLVSLLVTLVQIQAKVLCYQYKVGDLDAWGLPTSANSQAYDKWSKCYNIKIGDSLLFLYPPSQDSVIQVTEESYKRCNLKDPILFMNNGNSLFNITSEGNFYFTSGVSGHCQKNQKLHVSVGVGGNTNALSPNSLPEYAPSYPTVFGTIPISPSSSQLISNFPLLIFGFLVYAPLSTLL